MQGSTAIPFTTEEMARASDGQNGKISRARHGANQSASGLGFSGLGFRIFGLRYVNPNIR